MRVKLRRTCVACPNYTITLMGDGTLIYEGADLALVPGTRKIYIDAMTASEIFDHFVNSEFTELSNTYPSPGPDRMTVSLSLEMPGVSKAILSEDGYGPALLQELEHRIDDLPGMRALSGWTH